VEGIQRITDSPEQCIPEAKPEEATSRILARKMPEALKLRRAGGKVLYNYGYDGLITDHSNLLRPLLLGFGEETNTPLNISFV